MLALTMMVCAGATAASLRPDPTWHALVRDDVLSDGEHQRYVTLSLDYPRGAVVMLPGGSGRIGIASDGTIARADNVVVRTAPLWLQRGYAVVIPDAVDDRNLRGSRAQPIAAEAVVDLVDAAHHVASGPVFLIGTSQGAVAAVNGAAALSQGQIAGMVLLEAVSRLGGSHETVFDARPERVTAPVLLVANTADTCRVSPPEDASRIKDALTASVRVDVVRLSGGDGGGRDCSSRSPHGLAGLDAEVVQTLADWMKR